MKHTMNYFSNMFNEQFIKRLKSLLWRSAMMGVAVMIDNIAGNIGVLEMTPFMTTALGLSLGEISKFLNKK